MRLGHVIYRVENLKEAVEKWRNDGFAVEYGSMKNPYNAIIYFSEGPYIELLADSNMPRLIRFLLKLGKGRHMLKRIEDWESGKERWSGLCIEKDAGGLEEEIRLLKKYAIEGIYLKNGRRKDVHGRDLRFKCYFPDELALPFLMSYFEGEDPKPRDFTHSNGIKRIGKIKYRLPSRYIPILRELLEDDSLELISDDLHYGIDAVEMIR